MDRRNFLRTMIGGVAAGAAVRSWPFRVYSFPAEVQPVPLYGIAYHQGVEHWGWLGLNRSLFPIEAARTSLLNLQSETITMTYRGGFELTAS